MLVRPLLVVLVLGFATTLGWADDYATAHAWSAQPSPTTQDLWGVGYNGVFVAVGTQGTILESADGTHWTQQTSGTGNWLLGVAVMPKSGFVAVGDQGIVLGSSDGMTWTQLATGGPRLNGVAYGNGLYLAVGEGGATVRSSDGIRWSRGNAGVTGWLRGIVYAQGRFLVTGQAGTLLATSDGINFTALNSGTTNNIEGAAYGNGAVVLAGANGYLADSIDGVNWTIRRSPASADLRGATVFGTEAVAVGSHGSIFPSDLRASDWKSIGNVTAVDLYAVAASPVTPPLNHGTLDVGMMTAVAVGQGGTIAAIRYGIGVSGLLGVPLGTSIGISGSGLRTAPNQWYFNGQPIPGETKFDLVLANLQLSQAGTYAQVQPGYAPGSVSVTANYDPTIPGLIDEGFNPNLVLSPLGFAPVGVGGAIAGSYTNGDVIVQPDGKIVVSQTPPIRLNPDGTWDAAFSQGRNWSGPAQPSGLIFQSDGKIIAAWKPILGNYPVSQRFNPDGALDPSYSPHTVPDYPVPGVVTAGQDAIPASQLRDGRLLAIYGGKIVRLTPNAAIDETFTPLALPAVGVSISQSRDALGRVAVWTSWGEGLSMVYRLNADGTFDGTFAAASLPGTVSKIHPLADGKLLFETWKVPPDNRYIVGRLNADGSLDSSYPGLSLEHASGQDQLWLAGPSVAMPDGSLLIRVAPPLNATSPPPAIGGRQVQGIVRIDAKGDLDPSFILNLDAAAAINGMAAQADGKVLVWGDFTYFNGEYHPSLVRINPSAATGSARLVNLSALAPAGAGDRTLVVGFVVDSAIPKTVLLRGIGPGLGAFKVPGTLADPRITLFDGQGRPQLINENWQDAGAGAALAAAAAQLGAFALPTGSLDSALLATIGAGAHSVAVTASGDAGGLALSEVYDADPILAGDGGARIVNFSCRSSTGPGSVLAVGFVIGGAHTKRVLIRAVGPTLASFGIAQPLGDPTLTLYTYGTPIAIGVAGAGSATELVQAAQSAGAFSVPPNNQDSGVVITLSPGPYTVQITSASGSAGVVLIEVYELPD